MKYIKLYETFKDRYPNLAALADKYSESNFIDWLKNEYPDQDDWINIKEIDCSFKNLTSLKGIENLKNLQFLYCSYNRLTNLNGIENLKKLSMLVCNHNQLTNLNEIKNLNIRKLSCQNNDFSNEYKRYLKGLFNDQDLFI